MGQLYHAETVASVVVPLDAYALSMSVQNLGPDALYYKAGASVSAAQHDGQLNSGSALTITTATAFVAVNTTATFYAADTPTVQSGTATVAAGSTSALGTLRIQPVANVASSPTALGINATPQSLAQNGPFPLSPRATPNADAQVTAQALVGGLAASATVQTSPKDCSSSDYLYLYRLLFVGTAAASAVASSSPDMSTWTNVSGTLNAAAEGGVYVIRYEVVAAQAYMRTVLTNGVAAQGASARLVDGVELLTAA